MNPTGNEPPETGNRQARIGLVLLNRHVVFLDQLAVDIRSRSGESLTRSKIIRAILDALIDSDLNLSDVADLKGLKAILRDRPRS